MVALLTISTGAWARGGKDADRKAVEQIVDSYIKTINDGDLELVGKIWTHDPVASFIGPQGRFQGYNTVSLCPKGCGHTVFDSQERV